MSNIYQFPPKNQLPLAEHRFTVTIFPDQMARVQSRQIMTLDQLADLILNETGVKKKRLPFLKLAVFGDKLSSKGCLRHTANMLELTGIEIEHDAGTVSFDEVVERLVTADLRALVYTSPSYVEGEKEKWRVLAPLSAPMGVEVRARLVARLNGVVDGAAAPESFTLPQAYYFGRVGDNPGHSVTVLDGDFIDQREDLDTGAIGKPIAPRKDRVNNMADAGTAWGRDEEEIAALLAKSLTIVNDTKQWHLSMRSAVASMVGKRWTDEQIRAACKPYCPEGMAQIEKLIEGGREKWKTPDPGIDWSARIGEKVKAVAKASGRGVAIALPRWREIYQGGNPKASLHNARLAIVSLGIQCSRDVFHGQSLIGHEDAGLPFRGTVTDDAISLLRGHLSDIFGLDFTEKHVRDAVNLLCVLHRFNPVLDMLQGAQETWDGIERLDRMAVDYFNAADTPLNRQMVRKTMIAAVARVRHPGCKFDTILTMESREGWNKSSAWAVLAGEGNFSDASILGHAGREVQEQLASIWIHENAELAGMKKADAETIKAFASRQIDRARPAYGHYLVEQPRHSIEVGTTNGEQYLQSPTGNRRFWPIRVLAPIDLVKLRAARLQLWGEAAHWQASGESLTLNEELWQAAGEVQESRRVQHPWEALIDGMLVISTEGALKGLGAYGMAVIYRMVGGEERVYSADIFQHVLGLSGYQMHRGHALTLQEIMQRKNWEHKTNMKILGRQGAGYFRVTKDIPSKKVT